MNDREKWRESQGYPCWRHDMIMMMMIIVIMDDNAQSLTPEG